MLVSTHNAGIDLSGPVEIPTGVRVSLQPLQDPGPGAVLLPAGESVVAGLRRPVALRDLVPLRTVVDPPQNPVDHLPVITPPAPTLRVHARQQRLQAVPSPHQLNHQPRRDNDRSPQPVMIRQMRSSYGTKPACRAIWAHAWWPQDSGSGSGYAAALAMHLAPTTWRLRRSIKSASTSGSETVSGAGACVVGVSSGSRGHPARDPAGRDPSTRGR
jgi:hypothetical protein